MKIHSWAFSIGALLSTVVGTVNAYELATHGAITNEAYKRSVLKDEKLIKDLGIDLQTKPNEPFDTVYYDVSGASVEPRESNTFEDTIIQRLGVQPLALPGWLMRGAIREDDNLKPDNGQPLDDPYNTGDRVYDSRPLHHFYDPVFNRALTRLIPLSWFGVHKAPDWATGSGNVFNQPSRRRNICFQLCNG